MDKELRNPPANPVIWSFYCRTTDTRHWEEGRTAWLAVQAAKQSFQDCQDFVEGDKPPCS